MASRIAASVLRVDGGERIVEHEHLRLAHERAREGDALLLAARELHAALADDGVEPSGSDRDLVEHLGLARRRRGSRPCASGDSGSSSAKPMLRVDRGREEERVLLRVADGRAHRRERQIADVVAVEEHGARRASAGGARAAWRSCVLPEPVRPTMASDLPARDLEAHVVDDRAIAVREREARDRERAAHARRARAAARSRTSGTASKISLRRS